MIRDWSTYDGHHEPTRAQDLDERNNGLRGPQHNRSDASCKFAYPDAVQEISHCTVCAQEVAA